MKTKMIRFSLLVATSTLFLAGCQASAEKESNESTGDIHVVTREDGSGTRGAFIELTGVLVKEGDKETDHTYTGATIQNGTNSVMTTVGGDESAIGYTSVGSLNDSVKELKIENVLPTSEAIKEGTYHIARPFNVAYKGELSESAEDFWSFLFSAEGQQVVSEEGYIEGSADSSPYVQEKEVSGTISIVGSTSVTPVMEAITEAYKKLQPNVSIDITSNGSSAGMTAAMEESADIGMASRELKDEEEAQLSHQALAIDGIAVIVHPDNPLETLSMEEVRQIFTGEQTKWTEFSGE